jgi:hypothetical protein
MYIEKALLSINNSILLSIHHKKWGMCEILLFINSLDQLPVEGVLNLNSKRFRKISA